MGTPKTRSARRSAFREAALFTVLAFLFSWPVFLYVDVRLLPAFFRQGNEAAAWQAAWFGHMIGMMGPALAAMFMWRFVHNGSAPPWKWSRPGHYILSTAIMLAIWMLPGLAGLALPKTGFQLRAPLTSFVWIVTGAALTLGWLAGLGEETGWCAYLLPLLERSLGKTGAAAVSGIIRGLWHLPLLISPLIVSVAAGEKTLLQAVIRSLIFAVQLAVSNIFFGAIFARIWYKTKSLALAGWLHQWFDTARDVTALFIIGFARSPWAAFAAPMIINATGFLLLRQLALKEKAKGIFRFII
jgi:membrane protease YdiL (CAAX protease family)